MPITDPVARQTYHKTYYQEHRDEQLAQAKDRAKVKSPDQQQARRVYQRAYYAANRERLLEQQRERGRRNYRANPEGHQKRTRRSTLLRAYGLTEAQYEAMLTEQGGRCLICRRVMRPPAVDHCHTTGLVRGLLCRGCNTSLGHFRDDPAVLARAIEYLTRSSSGAISTPSSRPSKGRSTSEG